MDCFQKEKPSIMEQARIASRAHFIPLLRFKSGLYDIIPCLECDAYHMLKGQRAAGESSFLQRISAAKSS